MITVHHLEQSRSQRILWLLEELNVDYQIRHYKRDPETSLGSPDLFKVHPLGKSPVIDDNGRVIAETGAIVEYLINRYGHGNFRPAAGTDTEIDYLYWMHFAEGTAMPPLLMALVTNRIKETPMPFFIKPIARKLASGIQDVMVDRHLPHHFDLYEKTLEGKDFFLGAELTGADIMMSFPIEASSLRAGATEGRPHLAAWLKRIHGRTAYRTALEKGGPYDFGPQDLR